VDFHRFTFIDIPCEEKMKNQASPQIAWYYATTGATVAYVATQKTMLALIVAAIIIIIFKIRK